MFLSLLFASFMPFPFSFFHHSIFLSLDHFSLFLVFHLTFSNFLFSLLPYFLCICSSFFLLAPVNLFFIVFCFNFFFYSIDFLLTLSILFYSIDFVIPFVLLTLLFASLMRFFFSWPFFSFSPYFSKSPLFNLSSNLPSSSFAVLYHYFILFIYPLYVVSFFFSPISLQLLLTCSPSLALDFSSSLYSLFFFFMSPLGFV